MHLHYVTPSITTSMLLTPCVSHCIVFQDLGRRLRDAESRAQQAQPELAAKDRELEVGGQLMFTAISAVGSTKCGRCYNNTWCSGAMVHVLVHLYNVVYCGMLFESMCDVLLSIATVKNDTRKR